MLRKNSRNGIKITERTVKDRVSKMDTEDMSMVFEERFVTSTSQMTACLCIFLYYIQAMFAVVSRVKLREAGNYYRSK